MARKPVGWHPEDVRAALRKRYGTMAAFGRELGKARSTIANTISRPGYSVPLESAIADALGVAPLEIWPDRYHPDGSPVSYIDRRQPTAQALRHHRANGVVA